MGHYFLDIQYFFKINLQNTKHQKLFTLLFDYIVGCSVAELAFLLTVYQGQEDSDNEINDQVPGLLWARKTMFKSAWAPGQAEVALR